VASERTLIIIKPDAIQRGLSGTIITAVEQRGLRICALKLIHIDQALANKHYGVHEGKPFFQGLVSFITSSPVIVGVLEGPNAIETVRNTMGATNPVAADPGSIRGRLAIEIGHNLIHGSDSPETADFEIGLFFNASEIIDYRRDIDTWIGA
jgi:nucleoside-diphosphate kinase